jgi:internalin A
MTEEEDGLAIARRRVAEEAEARTGFLDLGRLGLTELPEELFVLKHLRRLNLGRWYRTESGELVYAESDLVPNDIQASLGRLIELPALRSLDCAHTSVSDLRPLAPLTALDSLDCSGTPVSDLGPLAPLTALQSLDCSGTSVSDLGPLAPLTALQSLVCSLTSVSDLGPLARLTALQSLDCWNTSVSDLRPLARLTALRSLDCSLTSVSDLGPLVPLTALQLLECAGLHLIHLPHALIERDSLRHLVLRGGRVPGHPDEILAGEDEDHHNCLPALRAHLADLNAGAVAIPDVKLMVLGNGRVGKTQICNRLRGRDFEADADSTHGIIVAASELPMEDGDPARLNIWDFGGQDIYHGTHALFLRANALFLLVWAPESEAEAEHVHNGMRFRNRPLPYWLDCVRHLGGRSAPVLIVQTRCDRPEDEWVQPPVDAALLQQMGFRAVLHYSALKNRKRKSLDDELGEAVRWLRSREGIATIGAGRHRVKLRLEALREEDAGVPPAERRYRTIAQSRFREICAEEGGVSSPEHLLDYLHNAGIMFYRKGLFEDRIVLDQAWALDAIYAVFNRDHCVEPLRQLGGHFTRKLLGALVWQTYGEAEQELFLSMMCACGICFVHKRGDVQRSIEADYIAPDLLPDRDAVAAEIDARWHDDLPGSETDYDFPLLHPGFMRGIIADIGGGAGTSAVYWQGGVCVYEAATRSHALIEEESLGGWRGRIRLRTQRGNHAALQERMMKLIEEQQAVSGLDGTRSGISRKPSDEAPAEPVFTAPPRTAAKRFYVSYAWNDDKTPEGREREAIVDRLCAAADARGTPVLRDKNVLRVGDSVSKFMDEIAQGDRVFAILSDKYLRSPFCMYELFAVWRETRRDERDFFERLRIYALPSARIWDMMDRLDHADYWDEQYRKVDEAVKKLGAGKMAGSDLERFKLMGELAHHVGDVLAAIADRIQPRSFEELVQYGLAAD